MSNSHNLSTQDTDSIIRDVEYVNEEYSNASNERKTLIVTNIQECYKDECMTRNESLSVEEFIEEMENSIGWDWILYPLPN